MSGPMQAVYLFLIYSGMGFLFYMFYIKLVKTKEEEEEKRLAKIEAKRVKKAKKQHWEIFLNFNQYSSTRKI